MQSEGADVLAIVRQTIGRRCHQLGLAPRIVTREVPHDTCDLGSVGCRQIEFALCPASNKRVEVLRVPLRRIPAESEEELRVHLVRLEIADVDDPNTGGMTINCLSQHIQGLR